MTDNIILILNGKKNDKGFVQEGFEGAVHACNALGLKLKIVPHTTKDAGVLQEKVRAAADSGARGVIVHGSRADAAIADVAPKFPKCAFLSPGGHASGANIWNYAIRHYEAAFLAGILAARLTETDAIGHLSGVPIAPGKRGRAAFAAGAMFAKPDIRIITGFCGDQDDALLAKKWVEAEADEGVDILFTMLNFGRSGAIEACRDRQIRQIGNIRDWTLVEPDVFVGSALARHGWSIRAWLEDLVAGRLEAGRNRSAGLETPEAVRLAIGNTVSKAIRGEIAEASEGIQRGEIEIAEGYDGPEFLPAGLINNLVIGGTGV